MVIYDATSSQLDHGAEPPGGTAGTIMRPRKSKGATRCASMRDMPTKTP
jgi:hypothetical protein